MASPTPLNNVTGLYLAAPHASGATSLVLNPGAGDQIRAAIAELEADDVSADHPIRATVAKVATVNSYGQIVDRTQLCIFDVTELSGDTLGGLTPVEGKTDLGFAAGDRVGFFLTADMLRSAAAGGPILASQLPASGVAPGTYGLATQVIDAKGRITSATTNTANGLLKANGSGAVTAATAGTDYLTPTGNGSGLTNLTPANLSAGTAGISITGNAATATTAGTISGSIPVGQVTGAAVDSAVVHKTGTESIDGLKTFTDPLVVGVPSRVITQTSGVNPIVEFRPGASGFSGGFQVFTFAGVLGAAFTVDFTVGMYFDTIAGMPIFFRPGGSSTPALFLSPSGNVYVGGASTAGSAGGQFEVKSKDASTPIAAGYDYLGNLRYLVGPDGTVTVSTGLKLPTSADASIPNSGIAWSSTDANVLKWRTPAGVLQTPNVGSSGGSTLLFVATADKTIANTTTETTLFGTGVGSLTVAANALAVGKTDEIKIIGNVSAASGSYRVRLKLGGVLLFDTTALTLNVANNQIIEIDAIITCRATGATSTVMGSATVKTWATTSAIRAGVSNVAFTVANVDTTIANDVDVTWAFGTAATGNTLTITSSTVKALN